MHQGHFASVSTPEVNQVQRNLAGNTKTCICQWPLVSLLLMMWSPSLQVLAKACSCLWLASFCNFFRCWTSSCCHQGHYERWELSSGTSFNPVCQGVGILADQEHWQSSSIHGALEENHETMFWLAFQEEREREDVEHLPRTSRDFVQLWEELLAISTSRPIVVSTFFTPPVLEAAGGEATFKFHHTHRGETTHRGGIESSLLHGRICSTFFTQKDEQVNSSQEERVLPMFEGNARWIRGWGHHISAVGNYNGQGRVKDHQQ